MEVYCYAAQGDDASEPRAVIRNGCDRFVEVEGLSHVQVRPLTVSQWYHDRHAPRPVHGTLACGMVKVGVRVLAAPSSWRLSALASPPPLSLCRSR